MSSSFSELQCRDIWKIFFFAEVGLLIGDVSAFFGKINANNAAIKAHVEHFIPPLPSRR